MHLAYLLAQEAAAEERNPILPAANELIWGAVAFFVLLFLMYRTVWPGVTKAYADRRANIEGKLEQAEKERAEAEELLEKYKQRLAAAEDETQRILEEARAAAEKVRRDLRAKATAHVRAGNNSAAGQYALRLQSVEAQLTENRAQLEQAETTYKNLVKARDVAVQTARAKIESLKGAINDMRMKQAMAELHEMAGGMITTIGGSGDTINRLHEMVEEERNKAAGRARVAKDSIDMTQVDIKEAEMTALADQALADFAAREGITLKGDAAPQPAERSMGTPESQGQ